MRETLRMIKLRDLALFRPKMENTLESGRTVIRRERVRRYGRTSRDMLGSSREDSRMARGGTSLPMTVFMRGSGLPMRFRDRLAYKGTLKWPDGSVYIG